MKTVLLVEDNLDVRELVAFVLRDGGYDVHEAENGQEALHQLETMRPPPCMLLLDLMMPVMTGPELLDVLRARNRLRALPVVVFSAGGEAAQVPGVQGFIRKPADPTVILNVVREVCGGP